MRRASTLFLLASFVTTGFPLPVGASFNTNEQVAVTRNAASPQVISATLTRDEYRYEERVETYIEQVPYTVEVPYEDFETYYTNEVVCEMVPREHRECHNEQRCERVPRQDCHNETRCHGALLNDRDTAIAALMQDELATPVELVAMRPGDRVRPAPAPRPRDDDRPRPAPRPRDDDNDRPRPAPRPEPRPEPRPQPRCETERVCRTHYENECSTVPVCHSQTRYENECRNVSVPHTRSVTRYRLETQYRPEQRTRVVTVPVFDHSWSVGVNVVMPEQSALQGDETETVFVRLAGSEAAPEADIRVESGIFNYRVASSELKDGVITAQLELVAKFAPGELGRQTVSGLMLKTNTGGSFITFRDAGTAARTTTAYRVMLVDRETGQTVFEHEAAGQVGQQEVMIPVTGEPDATHDHVIRLAVSRDGIVLAQPESFEVEEVQLVQLEPAAYVDPNGVREFSIVGKKAGAQLVFTDVTPNDSRVVTSYALVLKKQVLGFLWKKTVAKGVFARRELKHDGTNVALPLAMFPGMSENKLKELFDSGATVFVELKVNRVSERLKGHSPIQFKKSAQVRVKVERKGH